MKRIEVKTDAPYEVLIGQGLIEQSGALIRQTVSSKTALIVTDDIVNSLYGEALEASLVKAGFECFKFVFQNGEGSKNIKTYTDILEFAASKQLTRDDCMVALGGGVVGDITGFAAATYLRGIAYVQVPTTLLAMVDSSVGGKTAVDLQSGKNLVGAFYQPKLVIADTDTLTTLSENIFADGMAETVKYGILFDRGFFSFLNENEARLNLEYIVEKCVCFKRDIVDEDEKDRGVRGLLNLGHTVGHAIEKLSDYGVSHGSAVAIGTVIIARGAYKCGLCKYDLSGEIIDIYNKYSLPVSTDFSAAELLEVCRHDKKSGADGITLVLPETIGKCRLYKTDFNELLNIIEKGTE